VGGFFQGHVRLQRFLTSQQPDGTEEKHVSSKSFQTKLSRHFISKKSLDSILAAFIQHRNVSCLMEPPEGLNLIPEDVKDISRNKDVQKKMAVF
jgi:hypothetical protein